MLKKIVRLVVIFDDHSSSEWTIEQIEEAMKVKDILRHIRELSEE